MEGVEANKNRAAGASGDGLQGSCGRLTAFGALRLHPDPGPRAKISWPRQGGANAIEPTMDAVRLLSDQHRELERLMNDTLGASGRAARVAALARVGDDLAKHLTSEEEVFYPAVKLQSTEDILLESLEEHLSLKRLLADLLTLDPSAETWEAKFKVLKEQAEHHHREEEEHLFPHVRNALKHADLDALGEQLLALQRNLQHEGDPRDAVADQTDEAAPLK